MKNGQVLLYKLLRFRQDHFISLFTALFLLVPSLVFAIQPPDPSNAEAAQLFSESLLKSKQTENVWKLNWTARLLGRSVSDETEQSRVAGFNLMGAVNRDFNPYLSLRLSAGARFETGSVHSVYNINRVNNGLLLDEAVVEFHPLPAYVSIGAGAINQRFLQNPLLIDELSFPGVTEKLHWQNQDKSVQAQVVFEQTIPTSTSLSTRTAQNEPLPYFFSESGFLTVNFDPIETNVRLTHFQFRDLPSQVALDSFTQGNIVNADVPQNSRFTSTFNGYSYGADIKARLIPNLSAKSGIDFLTNTSAPKGYGNGALAFGQLEYKVRENWFAIPRFEYFRSERQTSPAYYNSADYGHNNRHGFAYELQVENPSDGLRVRARYIDGRLIEEDPLQANSKIIMLYLEIFDEAT